MEYAFRVEEAYTTAILLHEYASRLSFRAPKLQIVATDLDDRAIAVARWPWLLPLPSPGNKLNGRVPYNSRGNSSLGHSGSGLFLALLLLTPDCDL